MTATTGSATPPAATTAPGLAPTELRLSAELDCEMERLVEASYPYEACGLMVGRTAGRRVEVEKIFYARNLNARRPRDRYLLDPDDRKAADRAARAAGLDIVGIWHSHPDQPPQPSITDLEMASEGYSYLIVSTSAWGVNERRSWRLHGKRFLEEKIRQPDPGKARA